jgi:predicted transcriptional regulator of viral defense system
MTGERIKKAEKIFRNNGMVIKAAALRERGFCSKDIAELLSCRLIQRVKAGYYIWSKAIGKLSDMEAAAAVIKDGVICLHTAAAYHELTTMNPISVDIAVPARGQKPQEPGFPPVTIYRVQQHIFDIGINSVRMQYQAVRIYDKERTVCDFFRMRNKLGEDITLEVLRSYMSGAKNIQRL